jgi:ABC-type transport system substrate-binding protein
MRDTLYGGPEVMQVKGWGSISPSTIGYSPELDPYPYDPDKARQLLEEAGYPGGEGFGKFVVNTSAAIAMPFLVESAQATADVWKKELGIDVEVRVADRVGVEKALDLGELNGQMLWADNDTRISADRTLRSNYGELEEPDRTHSDPELSARVHEVTGIVDPDEREQAVAELMVELRRESYMLGVGYANIPWGVGPRVKTWRPYPLAGYPSALFTITLK